MRIGEILIGCQLIDAKALDEGLQYAAQKAVPIGRALRALKFLSEDNLNRALDAQVAMRMGLDTALGVAVLRYAYQTNRSFLQALKGWPGAGREKIPPELVKELSEQNLEETRTHQKPLQQPDRASSNYTQQEITARMQSRNQALEQLQQHIIASQVSGQPNPAPAAAASTNNPASKISGVHAAQTIDAAPNIDALLKEADALFAANKVIPAEKTYALAIRQMDDDYNVAPSKIVNAALKLANLYLTIDRLSDAQPLYERVLELQAKTFGQTSFEVAAVLEHLADLKIAQKQFPQAQSYLDQALTITQQQKLIDLLVAGRLLKKMAAAQHFDKPNTRTRLGELAIDSGYVAAAKVQECLDRSREAGALIGIVMRSEDLINAQQLESLMLAQLLIKQRTITVSVAVLALKLTQAEKIPMRQLCDAGKWLVDPDRNDESYQQLVIEQEKLLALEETHGTDHLEILASVLRLADLHLSRKDKASSEVFFKRALKSLDKQTPPDHLQKAKIVEKIAQVYCQQQRFAEAQPLLLKSLEYRKAGGTEQTVDAAKCLWLVAKVEIAQNNHATALSFLRSSKMMFDKLTPGNCPKQLLEEMQVCCDETGIPMESL